MKALITLLAPFLALAPFTAAHADFIPGRTRASAEASLAAVQADGVYKEVKKAELIQFQTDGKGVTRYDLKINGRTESYVVDEIRQERCGDSHVGRAVNEQNGRGEIRLFNTLSNLCEERVNDPEWTVEVSRHNADQGKISQLKLEGTPEYFMLTQDAGDLR